MTNQPKTFRERLRPRGNLVLLRKIERDKTSGGILLTQAAQDQGLGSDACEYEVMRVGQGAYNTVLGTRVPIELEPGDIVVGNPAAEFSHPEWRAERLYLMAESEVFGILETASEREEAT
jgi:co-chaperonin GroES (HSP10)